MDAAAKPTLSTGMDSTEAIRASGHRHENSDAHFQSEQDLFTPVASPTPDAGQDFIDVASFLEMGHVPNCWCRPCQDMYDNGEDMPELINPSEDEWMVCSSATGGRSPSAYSAWEWEWGTLVDDESDFGGVPCKVDDQRNGSEDWRCSSPSVKAHGAW